MALENLKSTQITARDATPPTLVNPATGGGRVVAKAATITPSASASLSSTYRLVDVPSNARIHNLVFASEAQAAGAFDIGVYRNTRDGGAVVDQDFFATAVNCSAAVALTDVINESGTNTLAKQAQQLWEAAGMSADPKSTLDIALTVTTAVTTGAVPVFLKVEYIV
jgi:predicted component of type VI protein secretion system